MPASILGNTIVVTKNTGSGNFQFLVQSPQGGIRIAFALLSADMATAAALGSGASSTFTYAQDPAAGPTHNDLPNSCFQETF